MLEKQHEGVSRQKTISYLDYVGMFHLGQNCDLQSNFSKFGILNPTILQNLLLLNKLHHHLYGRRRAYLYHLLNLVPTTGLHFSPSPKTTVMEEQVPVGSPCNRRQEGGSSQTEMLVISICLLWVRWDRWGSLEGLRNNSHCWRKKKKKSYGKCSHNTLHHTQENEIILKSRENKENQWVDKCQP